MRKPLVSIIIPCFNQLRFTKICIRSIFDHTRVPFELIPIDNGSADGTGEYLKGVRRIARSMPGSITAYRPVFNKGNAGVSGALNQGIALARGKYIVYLNNDTIVTVGWLEGLLRCAESDDKVGLVGCATNLVRNDEGLFPQLQGFRSIREIQRSAAMISLLRKGEYEKAHFVHGFCMLIKRGVVDAIGLFDERFYPCGGDDLDYSLRARKAGYKLLNAMDVFVFHFHSKATTSKQFNRKYQNIAVVTDKTRERFIEKWGKEGERFYRKMYLLSKRSSEERSLFAGSILKK